MIKHKLKSNKLKSLEIYKNSSFLFNFVTDTYRIEFKARRNLFDPNCHLFNKSFEIENKLAFSYTKGITE